MYRLRGYICAAVTVLFLSGLSLSQDYDPHPTSLSNFSESLAELTRQVAPAVVQVFANGYLPDKDDDDNTTYSKHQVTGSGVIVSPDGYIVTNLHVVKGAKRIRVSLNSPDAVSASAVLKEGPQYDATIVGAHKDTDLAVLKIAAKGLPTLPLAVYSELRQGQIVIAVGNPVGMRNAVSIGIISSVARQAEDVPIPLIQTDAAVNPGNSGGALVDTHGRLVGITSEAMDGQRLGFAIPSEVVRAVYDQIRKDGEVHQGDIGVAVQNVTPVIARGLGLTRVGGVIIRDVKPESTGSRAGLKAADVILTLDGISIGSTPEFESLLYFKKNTESVTLEVLRKSGTITLRVPVSYREEASQTEMASAKDPEKNFIHKLCIVASDLEKGHAEKPVGTLQPSGVLVSGRISDTSTFGCELQSQDVIHSVNGVDVADVESLRKLIDGFSTGDAVVLWIERSHKHLYVAFEIN